VRESEPRVGKDGLMAVTTEAVVNVKALQKSLNQMTRDERVEMIRANGDPKVSVQVTRATPTSRNSAAMSPVADNIHERSGSSRSAFVRGRKAAPTAISAPISRCAARRRSRRCRFASKLPVFR
jgi:hypothetical protein